jgi:hypothetical protein
MRLHRAEHDPWDEGEIHRYDGIYGALDCGRPISTAAT